jgi:hypothetical protein
MKLLSHKSTLTPRAALTPNPSPMTWERGVGFFRTLSRVTGEGGAEGAG